MMTEIWVTDFRTFEGFYFSALVPNSGGLVNMRQQLNNNDPTLHVAKSVEHLLLGDNNSTFQLEMTGALRAALFTQ